MVYGNRILGHVRWVLAQLPAGTMRIVATVLVAGALLAGCEGGESKEAPEKGRGAEVTLGSRDTTVPARTAPAPPRRRPVRRPAEPARPAIRNWLIPFPAKRRAETVAYTRRHYGRAVDTLRPKVIVEHYSVTPTAGGVHDLFARDVPDVELHELPGVCSHFVVDRDGTIYQLARLRQVCRHTVGLNQVALGIEHVGASDDEVLGNSKQLAASLRLTAWLRCRYGIGLRNVIGHNESLSSPYHDEQVPALQDQTHDDFKAAAMGRYRRQLAARRC